MTVDPKRDLDRQGWTFCPGVVGPDTIGMALNLWDAAKGNKQIWIGISGGYEQGDLLKLKTDKHKTDVACLHKDIETAAIKQLAANGIGTTQMRAKHLKLLLSHDGTGPQAPHMDGLHHNHFILALYLTPNRSTDMSILPYHQKDLEHMSAEERKAALPIGWSDDNKDFINFKCEPGDMMIFRSDVIHRGIKNDSGQDRLVLFSVICPMDQAHDDQHQYLEFIYAEEVYGCKSMEHIEALHRNLKYNPIVHYPHKRKRIDFKRRVAQFARGTYKAPDLDAEKKARKRRRRLVA